MNQDSRSIEDEVSALNTSVAVILSNYATKADLEKLRADQQDGFRQLQIQMEQLHAEVHKALLTQTWKMYGFAVILVTVVHFVTRAGY